MSSPISVDRIAENNSNLQPKAAPAAAVSKEIVPGPNLPQDRLELSAAAQNPHPAPNAQTQLPPTAEILLLQNQGQTMPQIASHFGVSVEQLLNYLSNPSASGTSGS